MTQAGKLVGIVTQTDLTRFQAVGSAELVSEIAHAGAPKTWPLSPGASRNCWRSLWRVAIGEVITC